MKDTLNVVVIGGVHHNTLGVIRSLSNNKISNINLSLIVIDKDERKNNFVASSKYISKKSVFVIKNDFEIIDVLLKISLDGKKRVIICCSDGSSEVVIKNRKMLEEKYFCPSTNLDISNLMSKSIQFEIAKKSGMKVPKTLKLIKEDDYEWNIFPCISKPEKSSVGGGKSDIHISNTKKELDTFIQSTVSNNLFIQEYINKDMEFQLIGCSLDNGNHIVIPGYTKIIRQPYNTNTGYLEYFPIDCLEYDSVAVENFIKSIGYNGLFSIEFLRDKYKQDYFLEINLRNDGNAYCVKSAGINLPFIWCYYSVYKKIPHVSLTFRKPIKFMPEFSDFKIGRKKVGLIKWFFQFITAKSHAVFSVKDLKPFIKKLSSHSKNNKKYESF